MNKLTFADLSASDHEWLRSQLAAVRQFVDDYSPNDAGQSISLPALDRAFAVALEDAESNSVHAEETVNVVGTAFGQALVKGAGFGWVVATDEWGTGLAIRALPGRGDVLIYPTDFVAKRWERRESSFLVDAYLSIREQIAAVEAEWAGK